MADIVSFYTIQNIWLSYFFLELTYITFFFQTTEKAFVSSLKIFWIKVTSRFYFFTGMSFTFFCILQAHWVGWYKLIFFLIVLILYLLSFFFYSLQGRLVTTNKYLPWIICGNIFVILNLPLCTNFLSLFFFIEVLGSFYFFFFLHSQAVETNSSDYKSLIIFYIWLAFWTSIIYGLGIGFIAFKFGTVDFIELSYCATADIALGYFFILLSIFLKVSVPGIHFFKAKLYNILVFDTLLWLSIFSLFFLMLLIYWLFTSLFSIATFQWFFSLISILFLGFLIPRLFMVTSLTNFLIFSSFFSIITLLIFLL